MIKKVRFSWWGILAAVMLLAPCAFSQTVNLTLLDGGSNGVVGDIYVGPYDASVNGSNQSSQIICDDFKHDVSQGQSWTANVTSLTSITDGTTGLVWSGATAGGTALFGNGYVGQSNFDMVQGYTAEAYLASQLLNAHGLQAGYLAYAIWSIFDASDVQTWLNNHGAGSIWAKVQSLAEGALNAVLTGQVSQSTFAGWEVLTPAPGTGGPPQEFFMYVPEGGTALMYLLLAGFVCFGTMLLKSRRRASQVI